MVTNVLRGELHVFTMTWQTHSRKLQSSSAPEWDPQILQVLILLTKFRSYPCALLLLSPNKLPNLLKIQKSVKQLQLEKKVQFLYIK
jgi:hypothetical protein